MKKLYIIGDISWESYRTFTEELAELETDNEQAVEVELASDGGDAHAALAFFARIQSSKLTIRITARGNVASAAVLILAAGEFSSMSKDAWVMVHEDQAELSGSVTMLEKETRQMRALENQWNSLLEMQTDTSAAIWAKLHRVTTYLTAEQCLELGLVNKLI